VRLRNWSVQCSYIGLEIESLFGEIMEFEERVTDGL